jgi:NodT family efflux transporter outer membrane factor (OMF) lipoprotein
MYEPPRAALLPHLYRASPVHPACAIVLALTLLFSGCSLVPAYKRPDAPLAERFDGAASISLANTTPVRSEWWRAYQDPELNALVERSLQNNFSLASAVATVEEARGNAERAGAPLYPSLTLGATYDRSHQGGTAGTKGWTGKSQSVFLEASYEIDFWGLNAANANAAMLLARASEFDRDTVALTLTASVVNTYFEIQSLRRRVTLARTISTDAEHILQLLIAQKDAGVATELQIEQQRNALATFQANVPVLQQQLDQSLHSLAVLTGSAPEQLNVGEVQLSAIPIPAVRPNLPSSLLEARPDIRSKEATLQSANYSVGAARAAYFPALLLTADGGLSSGSLSHFLTSPFASLASALAVPIFDGGASHGQLHANQAAVTKGVADYRQTIVTALQDVEDSLTAAQQQQLAEAFDQTAADAARQAATLAEAQYKFGTVDFLTVLDAQRTLYQAEDTLVQARLLRLQASAGLFRAFGGGFGVTDSAPQASPSNSQSNPGNS